MITVFTGENDFEIRQAIAEKERLFDGNSERIDGASVTLSGLPDLLMGVSLFATQRLVIIDQLSASSAVWQKLPQWLTRSSDTIELILIEPTLDKRTSTYKALKAAGAIEDFPAWTEKDTAKAEAWAVHYGNEQKVAIARPVAAHLVRRVGVNQWLLSQAVHILALAGDTVEVTAALIDSVIVASPEDTVFQLLDYAMNGDANSAVQHLRSLESTQEPHRLMALILSQVYTLAAAVLAPADADPAKDFGIHPFVISKLQRLKKSVGPAGAFGMVRICAQADTDLKSSKADPWVLVERLIVQIAHRQFS